MALLKVLKVPDPRLKLKAHPVEKVDGEIQRLMDDMLETMYHDKGCGLAATQVGIQKRIVVIDFEDERTPEPLLMANPEIVWYSDKREAFTEGCLSVPDQWTSIVRASSVKFHYLDRSNKRQELTVDGIFGACIQHEIDHLNGVLFVDHLSSLKRNLLLRRAIKIKQD
ncbi:MAG: peptide deformylase [Candidatus Paracaedimonas acanthamoebae]|uniref:Peptide deformylase n=1 Tax=Candidatus Paracaedimonas acanthamoebae TaxID=244581 RepID=A0A8J7PT38_9PROT|nr:peptide deformylase [Candidatus Paracaedimonas acanthamoebae]